MASQAQLDALEAALHEGVLEVQYEGRKVVYRSLTEMLQIRNMLRRELGYTTGTARRIYHSTSKGLGCTNPGTDEGGENNE